VMPDDPAFEPIYKDIAAHNRAVVAHLAEPDSCWQPPNPASPDYEYYQQNPQEYAYAHPGWPSKAAILAARDHLVAESSNPRVIGAHLGSMETDVNQMAERFDRFPNFAVDKERRSSMQGTSRGCPKRSLLSRTSLSPGQDLHPPGQQAQGRCRVADFSETEARKLTGAVALEQ
jgi:hypothetical protein